MRQLSVPQNDALLVLATHLITMGRVKRHWVDREEEEVVNAFGAVAARP